MVLERPIVIFGNKAVIGRPPEKIYDLFELEKEVDLKTIALFTIFFFHSCEPCRRF